MRIFSIIILIALPLASLAEGYSNAPMLVVKQSQAQPLAPASPPHPPAPTSPASPPSPTPPPSPINKLWPRDAIPIFMTSCTKFHPELIDPCGCIITKVMRQFPHDEFLKIDAAGAIATDPRLLLIRQQCVDEIPVQKKRALQDKPS